MKKNSIIKIIITLAVVFIGVVLIKKNVTAIKERFDDQDNQSFSVTNLDINFEIVQTLYNSLNLDLVDNTCEMNKCLLNNSYTYLYYQNYDNKKELSDDEKLYFAFNSLYLENNFTSKEVESTEKKTVVFDGETVKNKITQLFGQIDYTNFTNTLKLSSTCGVTDYIYTGSSYELTLTECTQIRDFAKSKLYSATKENNYIYLIVNSFYAYTKKNEFEPNENVFTVKEFDKDELLTKTSLNELDKNTDNIFNKYETSKYTFKFELKSDNNYYLSSVEKGA